MPSTKSPSASPRRRLNVGVIGIGRIGRQHALNALHPGACRTRLVCACSPAPADRAWAEAHLVPHGVRFYATVGEMLDAEVPKDTCKDQGGGGGDDDSNGLEAVVIASTTRCHRDHVGQCLRWGLHVLCEKPLAMSAAEARAVAREVAAVNNARAHKKKKAIKVMTAFSRRFDDSYVNAVRAVRAGRIGTPVVVRSETRDRYDPSPFYAAYARAQPGIFIDTAVHDIDLTLAFFGAGARPRSARAIGTTAKHQEVLAAIADVDNAVGCVEWYPPAGGTGAGGTAAIGPISYYFFSRIMPHGFDNPTEIIGTEGVLKINLHPRRDLVTVADRHGLGNDVMPDFYERYEKAFVTELHVFADCVLDDEELPYELETACKGMEIAAALQESLRTGKTILWDDQGNRQSNSGGLDGGIKGRL